MPKAQPIAKQKLENNLNVDNDVFAGTGQKIKGDTTADFKGNTNLDTHLTTGGPHKQTVYGAHSDEAYQQAIRDKGFTDLPDQRRTVAPGIYENTYLDKGGVPRTKTTYDPSVWSDAQIQAMSRQAVVKVEAAANRGEGVLPKPLADVETKVQGVPFVVRTINGRYYAFPGEVAK
jgi:hypothetical protein